MRRSTFPSRAFTLLELILVMGILTVVAAAVAPRLAAFGVGRKTKDAGAQIVALARYARTQAVAESRTWRLNLDAERGSVWLTVDDGTGTFAAASGDVGRQFQMPEGVTMTVNLDPQPNIALVLLPSAQQQSVPQPAPVDGRQNGQPGFLMQNVRTDAGQYVEFQPTGRSDPAEIRLADRLGNTVEVSCASPTEMFRVVQPSEAR